MVLQLRTLREFDVKVVYGCPHTNDGTLEIEVVLGDNISIINRIRKQSFN